MREEAKHSYSFKSFRLDIAERRLVHDGISVPLAPRAFEVLAILVENAGHLIEKEQLLQEVWHGSFVDEANIARVIHTLRRALHEDEKEKFIETVAKRGYRFVAEVRPAQADTHPADGMPEAPDLAAASRPTNSFQAYQLARYHYNQMTPPDLIKSRALLEEALRFDKDFAPAYAALAEQAVQEVVAGLRRPNENYPEARRALVRARDLDPNSVEFHSAAGFVTLLTEWDFSVAEAHLKTALDINPHHAFANCFLGQVYMFDGRPDAAAPFFQTAADLEPLNLAIRNLIPIAHFLARQYHECVEECDKMLAIFPRFIVGAWIRCWALEQIGRATEAVAEYERMLAEPNGHLVRRWIGFAYALSGEREKAFDNAARLDAESHQHYLSPTHQAQLYAGLGDQTKALHYLNRAAEEFDPWLLWIATDPRYDRLRTNPEFESLVKQVTGPRSAGAIFESPSGSSGTVVPKHRVTRSGLHAIVDLAEWNALVDKVDTQDAGLRKRSRGTLYFGVGFAAVLLIAIFGTAWYVAGRRESLPFPVFDQEFRVERLSTDGKVLNVAISPNGKLVVYSHIGPHDTSSLWLRNLETGHNRELISPSLDVYFGVTFAPDGDWLYFVRRPRGEGQITAVYRLSIHGGAPQKITSDTQGWLSISPDAKQIAFLRCAYTPDDNCSLFIADALDGQSERKLVTRPRPQRIRDIDFSPDGRTVAFAAGQSENEGLDFQLWAVDVATGTERTLSSERFFNITGVEWLADETTILVTASQRPTYSYRIWRINSETGAADALTKGDSGSYLSLSVDHSASKIVCTQYEEDFRIRLIALDGTERLTIPKAGLMSFARDGGLYFTSTAMGGRAIWHISADGKARSQLTDGSSGNILPVASANGEAVFFSSNRTGSTHVWRMNTDGTDQRQLTKDIDGFVVASAPDGEWVYYRHGTNRHLWRVRVRGEEEQEVFRIPNAHLALSSDASRLAYSESKNSRRYVVVVSLPEGTEILRLESPEANARITQMAWLPDGTGLAYFTTTNEFHNNTLWLQVFGREPRMITKVDQLLNEGGGLAISPDGKTIAVSHGTWLHDAVLLLGLK